MPEEFPKFHPYNVPETYWCVNPKTSEVEQLVTVMPDGVKIGWGTCAICTNEASRCICPQGVLGNRANEWIYIHALARFEGDRLETPTSVDSMSVTSRALHWYAPKAKGSGSFTLPPPRKPAQPAPAPEKRTLSRSKPVEFDQSKTDEAATDMAKSLTRSLNRSLKKSEPKPKRTLKRKN
jgi:hypothetical protein